MPGRTINSGESQHAINCKHISQSYRDNRLAFRARLDAANRKLSKTIMHNVKFRRYTGIPHRPVKNAKRLVQFIHFILGASSTPPFYAIPGDDDKVAEFIKAVQAMKRDIIGEGGKYVLGGFSRPHYYAWNDGRAYAHDHEPTSCIRLRVADRGYIANLEAMPEDMRLVSVLYLLDNPWIHDALETVKIFSEPTKELLHKTLGIALDQLKDTRIEHSVNPKNGLENAVMLLKDYPLLTATAKSGQNQDDRDSICDYVPNDSKNNFANTRIGLIKNRPDLIRVEAINKQGDIVKKTTWDAFNFHKNLLLIPNKLSSLRFPSTGFMHSSNPLSKVLDYASRIGLKPIGNQQPVKLIDLPAREIGRRGAEYREAYLSGDAQRLEAVKDRYVVLPKAAEKPAGNKAVTLDDLDMGDYRASGTSFCIESDDVDAVETGQEKHRELTLREMLDKIRNEPEAEDELF